MKGTKSSNILPTPFVEYLDAVGFGKRRLERLYRDQFLAALKRERRELDREELALKDPARKAEGFAWVLRDRRLRDVQMFYRLFVR